MTTLQSINNLLGANNINSQVINMIPIRNKALKEWSLVRVHLLDGKMYTVDLTNEVVKEFTL